MSDSAPSVASDPILLKLLGIGKLSQSSDGTYNNELHELIHTVNHHDCEKSIIKSYKSHCKAIMSKGAHKLQLNKRIRLTSDDSLYDVHVLCESMNNSELNCIVIFAICSTEFNKTQSITKLMNDYKSLFYEYYTVQQIFNNHSNTTLNCNNNDSFNQQAMKLISQYNTNILGNVTIKVEQVRDQMKESVARAITNVEQLEEMEEKSEEFEAQAKRFQKNSRQVRSMFCKRNAMFIGVGGVIALAILIYIIYAVSKK